MGFKLSVENLTVHRGNYTLLQDVSFDVEPGEFLAIIGPNGAGKTTLLKSLRGERPQLGVIKINSENLYENPDKWFPQIGFVPVNNMLHEGLTVEEALWYVGELLEISEYELNTKIGQLLVDLEIEGLFDKRVRTLSSGEMKRANICAELLVTPGLLLLDEPTSNLDPYIEDKLMSLLGKLAKQGTTIVVVSHTINTLSYCDRAIFVGNSEAIHNHTAEELKKLTFRDWVADFGDNQTQPRQPESIDLKPTAPLGRSANTQEVPFSSIWNQYKILTRRQSRLLGAKGFAWPIVFGLLAGFLLNSVLQDNGNMNIFIDLL